MEMTYHKLTLSETTSPQQACSAINATNRVWAALNCVFGGPSNQIVVIADSLLEPSDAWTLDESNMWHATARPTDHTPLTEPGIYIHRKFMISPSDKDEFVNLSRQAWQSFETDEAFASRPYGLFSATCDQGTGHEMSLITWYESFTAWERSRAPHADAQRCFAARAKLTTSTVATAHRLIPG